MSIQLDVDLADVETYRNGTPHHLFRRLRHEAPVYWNERNDGGPGLWCVTKYADVLRISRDPERFTSTIGLAVNRQTPEEDARNASFLIGMDPPKHTKYRRVVHAGFTPRRIAALEPDIRRAANLAIDAVIEAGQCDFFDVAAALPIRMICQILGIPEEDHLRVLDWTNRTFGGQDPDYAATKEESLAAYQEVFAYAFDVAAKRRANPGDDLVSTIATSEVDGALMDDMTVVGMIFLILGAGNDTTRGVILNSTLRLAREQALWREICADPSVIPVAADEAFRLETSVRGMGRGVVEDTVIGDQTMRAGDQVYMWYVSSNRDEDVFTDSDRFDVHRANASAHQTFGSGGPHYCLGAAMARLQVQILMDVLRTRLPAFELNGEPSQQLSVQFNQLKSLPLRFEPGARVLG